VPCRTTAPLSQISLAISPAANKLNPATLEAPSSPMHLSRPPRRIAKTIPRRSSRAIDIDHRARPFLSSRCPLYESSPNSCRLRSGERDPCFRSAHPLTPVIQTHLKTNDGFSKPPESDRARSRSALVGPFFPRFLPLPAISKLDVGFVEIQGTGGGVSRLYPL